MNRTIQSLQRMLCSLRGHDEVFHFERRRLSLRCLNCGHETTGWILRPEPRRAEPPASDVSPAHIRGFARVRRVPEAFASACRPAIQ
jgi:hypothetical protein